MLRHVHGSGRPEVVALHGFTQHGGHLAEFADHVGVATLAPDLPGHGPTPLLPATMEVAVGAVVDLLDETGVRVLVGYSMGGRVALRVALRRPLDLLVLVAATAGIRDDVARGQRADADDALADRLEAEGLEAFIDHWGALPMFSGLDRRGADWRRRDRALRLVHDPMALAASLRGMGQGTVDPIADAVLATLAVPTLLLAGSADRPYAIEAERMAGLVPDSMVALHPTAGHAVVGEDPGWVADQVRRHLER